MKVMVWYCVSGTLRLWPDPFLLDSFGFAGTDTVDSFNVLFWSFVCNLIDYIAQRSSGMLAGWWRRWAFGAHLWEVRIHGFCNCWDASCPDLTWAWFYQKDARKEDTWLFRRLANAYSTCQGFVHESNYFIVGWTNKSSRWALGYIVELSSSFEIVFRPWRSDN